MLNSFEISPLLTSDITSAFEDCVKSSPTATAVIYNNQQYTYQYLNEQSNRLANLIKSKCQLNRDDLIGICLDRSLDTIISILAILKLGCAFVPVDPNYPNTRISYILVDTACKILLSSTKYSNKLIELCNTQKIDCNVISIDQQHITEELTKYSTNNLIKNHSNKNLAYVMYTSGTTGTPKGVMVEHINILSLIYSNFINREQNNYTLLISDLSFDATTIEIFLPLLTGGYVYVPNSIFELISNSKTFQQVLIDYSINVLWLTKSLFDTLVTIDESLFKSVDTLIIGGEALNATLVNQLIMSRDAPQQILNGYGPTENTTFSCIYKITKHDKKNIPIGKPISGRYAYILDDKMNIITDNSIGELYLSGLGIARGYLNSPELTKDKFLPNPYQTIEQKKHKINDRLYKTGDLARFLSDGNIEFIGRVDSQIKIRGYRVELTEIDHQIQNIVGIVNSVSIIKENQTSENTSNKLIVSFFMSKIDYKAEELLQQLKTYLPEHMLPSYLVPIDSLPLTSNGKVDNRKLLLEFDSFIANNQNQITTETQTILCEIYAKILGIDKSNISLSDNLFRLGGNSIAAIKIYNLILQNLPNSCLTINDIFNAQNIASLATKIDTSNSPEVNHLKANNNQATNFYEYTPSIQQQSMWSINELQTTSGAYQITLCGRIVEIDQNMLTTTINYLLKNNEIFRSLITIEHNKLIQKITPETQLEFHINSHNFHNEGEILAHVYESSHKRFDLAFEYPLRINVYKNLTNNYQYLVFQIHHIAFDGYSLQLLQSELNKIYNSIKNNTLHQIKNNNSQYQNYANWQKNYRTKSEEDITYWLNELSDLEPLNLPNDYTRPQNFDYSGKNIAFMIDKNCSNNLRTVANKFGISLFSVLLSAFNILINIYSNQSNFGIGIPYINRNQKDSNLDVIGFFINPLVIKHEKNQPNLLIDYIIKTSKKIITAITHSSIYFEEIVELLKIERDTSRNPLFQVMFSLQQFTPENWTTNFLEKDSLTSAINTQNQAAIFDLLVILDDSNTEISGYFNYATSIFTTETIEKFIQTYITILNDFAQLLTNHNLKITDLNFTDITKKIQYKIPKTSNNPSKTVIDQFLTIVQQHPNRTALNFAGQDISYYELDKKTNLIANYLINNLSINSSSLIALLLSRSDFMVASIIAILKTGCGYLPIDKNIVPNILNYILEDSKPLALICDTYFDRAPLTTKIILPEEILAENDSILSINNSSIDQLAYLLYTSGTTGKPKGVAMSMRGLPIRISEMIKISNLSTQTKYLFKTNYIFDVSFSDIFSTLCSGGTLYITKEIFDLNEIINLTQQYNINTIHFVPTQLSLIKDIFNTSQLNSIMTINVSGEGFPKNLLSETNFKGKVINYYGPTETGEVTSEITDYSNYKLVLDSHNVTIGYPILGNQLLILNNKLQLLPDGAVGELYIGGLALANGYLNLDQFTKERFVKNPFQSPEEKSNGINKYLYKTGDLVRRIHNGNIKYLGRNDGQIKFNGVRIELGEIETIVKQIPAIKQSVVLIHKENDHRYLICYYVSDYNITNRAIIEYISNYLPQYMIPKAIIQLDDLPITPNGKLDTKALPSPKVNIIDEYEAPSNQKEKIACEILASIIDKPINEISVNSDFFQIGGNSILAIKFTYLLNSHLSNDIKAFDIFHKKTIRNIVNNISTEFIEHADFYEYTNNSNQITTQKTLIFIPGCEPGFERNYKEIINSLNDGNSHKIIMLKSKFTVYDNIKKLANYYTHIIQQNFINNENELILLGFSAGGEIGYFIAKNIESSTKTKLVLFDSYMNHDNWYSFIRFTLKKLFNAGFEEHHWFYLIPEIRTEILFFKACLHKPRKIIIEKEARFRILRQIKANFEYWLEEYKLKKGNLNNIKSYMNIYKIINIQSEHNGENGILSLKHTNLLNTHIQKFINRD